MQKAILGKKIGMTQIFTEDGLVIPVTVVQKKTVENDGYNAIQVGYVDAKDKAMNKPQKGHLAKAGVSNKRVLKEFRLEDDSAYNVGDEIKVDVFAEGDKIDVTGISKGHGYAGTVKRWGTHRGPMSHGSGYHRGVGSMGACSTPSRVMKNKRLPGHMGVEQVTVQNLDVVKVDAEKNIILVKGAVPGPKGGVVTIKNSVKA